MTKKNLTKVLQELPILQINSDLADTCNQRKLINDKHNEFKLFFAML